MHGMACKQSIKLYLLSSKQGQLTHRAAVDGNGQRVDASIRVADGSIGKDAVHANSHRDGGGERKHLQGEGTWLSSAEEGTQHKAQMRSSKGKVSQAPSMALN